MRKSVGRDDPKKTIHIKFYPLIKFSNKGTSDLHINRCLLVCYGLVIRLKPLSNEAPDVRLIRILPLKNRTACLQQVFVLQGYITTLTRKDEQ